ncbi:hypothetical protein B0T17DRAFT_587492 [Bombardia bombarda]|uniref:Urease accessory protein n=1 Tax=Bombardia bombarda TaxID=252184 RepID=A0AA39XLJ7_9PEZI|nr:hypothetical protein B0T17DRAFT_587492 [Bombardia bombarda]
MTVDPIPTEEPPCSNGNGDDNKSDEEIEREIADLERRLAQARAKAKLRGLTAAAAGVYDEVRQEGQRLSEVSPSPNLTTSANARANHFLFLLSDSALPLGSFAFSSGLESYLAHSKADAHHHPSFKNAASFSAFLPISVSSYASTTLPFVLAAHRDPSRLAALDDALDATIICTVGRRASVAQGRALLSIWDRSFADALPEEATLRPFMALLKSSPSSVVAYGGEPPLVSAHLAPLFGAISNLAGLSLAQTAYVFMLGHVKALVSAAGLIAGAVAREWETEVERAGQSVPVMDLWFGRHEMLYSRIFNS